MAREGAEAIRQHEKEMLLLLIETNRILRRLQHDKVGNTAEEEMQHEKVGKTADEEMQHEEVGNTAEEEMQHDNVTLVCEASYYEVTRVKYEGNGFNLNLNTCANIAENDREDASQKEAGHHTTDDDD